MMKRRIKTRKASTIAVISFFIALLIGTSAVFSPQFFTASAYSQSELAQAEKAESLARQEYEKVKSEAAKLEAIKQGFDKAGQDKILADAVVKIKGNIKTKITEIVDSTIDDIADVYDNRKYTQEQKLEETEDILIKTSDDISALIKDSKKNVKIFYDEYIEVFLDDRIDYSYVHDTFSSLVSYSVQYIDFLLWDLFLDMENGNDIEEKRDTIHDAIAEESTNIENTIKYEIPGWVDACIDREIANIMGDLEETWQEELDTLVEIRQELYQYDYSVNPEAINYTKNTYKFVTFKINGDLDAIKKIEHFDMQKTPVWSDAYQANVIFGERISLDEDYVLEAGENNTIILKIKNAFLDKQTQGDHIFRLYYMTENGNEYVSFIVSSLPQGWVETESYDDGQDWPMLAESEYMEEVVSATDVDVTEQSSESSGFRFMWIIVLAIILVLIAAAILIFLIIYKKKSLKNESENDIIKKEKASKKEKHDKKEKSIKPKTKNKNRTKKNLLSLFLVLGTLVVSFSSLNAYAASGVSLSVSNIRYTIPGNPPTVKKLSMSGNAVTVSGWGITYDFDILGWKSTDPDVSWEDITITGNGVSVAKGAEGKATFTTTNNPTSGTRTAGKVTVKSPIGEYTFTVKQYVITYDIIYNANGGIGAPAQQSKKHLINLKLSSVKPTREGYTFIGWATSPAASEASYNPGQNYKTNKHLSLYAVWKPNNIKIIWNANGGSILSDWSWKTVGAEIGTLPTTKRANYDFDGWYTGANGTGQKIYTFTKVPVRSTTYYAKWKLKSGYASETTSFSASPNTMNFTYNSTEKQSVTVKGYEGNSSKINYWNKLSISTPNWITVSKDSKGKLSISVKENTKTQARSGNIVLKSYDGDLCKINITQSGKPVSVSSVSLNKSSVSIDIGETVILWESIYPEDAANKMVKWTTSNETIATVSPNGIVKGVKQGTVTITVTTSDGNKTAKCKVKVNPSSITVVPPYITLHVGEKTNLNVECIPSYYKYSSIKWSRPIAFRTAADVDSNGTVTAIRPGTTVITAKANDGRKSTCTVTVIENLKVTSVNITQKSVTLFEGDTKKLSTIIEPSDAKDKSLKWSSSDPSIATVDSNGLVKGVKGGTSDKPRTVTIIATAQDGSGKKATCKVTILAPSEIWFATAKTQIQNISPGQGISVKGIVKSNHKLKSITVSIFEIDPNTGKETVYLSSNPPLNNNSSDLSKIDKEITFSELPEGSYKFVVKATDIYGYEKTLQSEAFDVSKFRFTKNAGVDIANVDARLMNRLREMGIAYGLSSIHITSGYRSYDKQKELYDGWVAGKPGYNPANQPGKSWHEFGGAVDIGVWDSSLTNKDFKKYKLSRPAMPKEPWHIQISEIGSSPRASSTDEGKEYFESITKWG